MILERLTLCDFRAYHGVHEIDLGSRAKYGVERPIVLFGGLNGAGKTTLLLAVKLALYGRHALGMGTSKAAYTKFIRGCIHTSPRALVQPNSAYVELAFVYGKLGRRVVYVVRRSWYDDGRKIHESLSLVEDGKRRSSLSAEACQGFLNELVPLGVSELFFFDGEKIAELAEDDSGSTLGDAVSRLLGLDLVERLRSDLRVYMLRSESKGAGKDVALEIERLQRDYDDLKTELALRRVALDAAQSQRDALVANRDRLEVRLTERGGDWGISRQAQRTRAKDLAEALKREERDLRDLLAGPYPLSLATDVLADALDAAATDFLSLSHAESNELLRTFATTLKGHVDEPTQMVVDDVLAGALKPEQDADGAPDLSRRALARMEHTVHHAVPDAVTRVERVAAVIAERKDELDTVALRIEQAPDEAVLAAEFGELGSLNEQITEAGAEVAVLGRELKSGYAKAIELARSLRDKHKALAAQQEMERPLEYANGARELLKDFRRINAERKIQQLEEEFAIAFRRLARKEDIVAKASIDPHHFTVKLKNAEGGEIEKSHLSAGEKQIYANCHAGSLGPDFWPATARGHRHAVRQARFAPPEEPRQPLLPERQPPGHLALHGHRGGRVVLPRPFALRQPRVRDPVRRPGALGACARGVLLAQQAGGGSSRMIPHRVRVSEQATARLKYLKSRTGLTPNILSRFAFLLSARDLRRVTRSAADLAGQEFLAPTLFWGASGVV